MMRFGVNKKDGCAARTGTWGIVYNPETLCFEKVKSSLRAFHPKPNMCQSAAPSVTVNLFLYRRLLQREVPAVGSNLGFLQFEAELPEPGPYRPFLHGAVL